MSGFENERTVLGTLLNSNWNTTSVAWPGRNFTPPARSGDPGNPSAFVEFHIENVFAEEITVDWVQFDSAVEVDYFEEEAGQGDQLIRSRIDSLMAIFRNAHGSNIYFDEPYLEPSNIQFPGTKGEWRQATIRIPYRRFADISTTEILTLVGQGDNQVVVEETSHGFAVKDWVGESSGTWSKAQADGVAPLSQGVVSTVIDANKVVVTTVGAVRISSHGYSEGALYLDQNTAGAATSTAPTSGISQQVAVVVDSDVLVVNQYAAQDLG